MPRASSLAFLACLLTACGVSRHASYESCGVSADCSTTTDRCLSVTAGSATAGLCSTPCETAAECPPGHPGGIADCRVFSDGRGNCFQACTVDDDCHVGFACFDPEGGTRTICMPSSRTATSYESCASATCDLTADRCVPIANGAATDDICSRNCTTSSECPLDHRGDNGFCRLVGGVGTCFQACTLDADCNAGFVCLDPDGGSAPICIPG